MIDRFTGEYRFLSNFWPCKVEYEGMGYPSVEHAYQAAKTLDVVIRCDIRDCDSPGKAKRMGARVPLRDNWETIKQEIMLDLVWRKFQNPDLRQQLLATGEQELVEGNNHGDFYWGVCEGRGQNHLGEILMFVRDHLRHPSKTPTREVPKI